MKIYVIRHGETEQGRNRIIANLSEPLNEKGINQAINVGKELRKLNLNKIYCSPIERAKYTLELFDLDKNIPVVIEDRLKERAAKGVDQRQALERLNWNIAYLNKYYIEDTWINTEEKSAENVADEIFRMIEKSRLQKYT